MRIDDTTEINNRAGRWILTVELPSTGCCYHSETVCTDVNLKDIVEAIRRYAPELLKEE